MAMSKETFYKILLSRTPEELNEYISAKGTKKLVNAVTFLDDETVQNMQVNNDMTNDI